MRIDAAAAFSEADGSRPSELRFVGSARPPCRAARRRQFTAVELADVRRVLALGPDVDVDVVEWIAMDARETAHVSVVRVHARGATIVARFPKPAARLTAADARVLRERSLLSDGAAVVGPGPA